MSLFLKQLSSCFSSCVLLLVLAGCGDDSPSRATPFSIGGTITAAAGSAVDSDVNDPLAPYAGNDSYLSPQLLPNPVLLGGYATAVATGVTGDRFASDPDIQDWYRMTLAAGQTLVLTISDHDGNDANTANPDFDLFLVNPDGLADVQSSETTGRQETITLLTGGDYYVQIYSFVAGSNYTLSIGTASAPLATTALRVEDDFVPGEIILRLRDPAPAAVAPQSVTDRVAALGLHLKAGGAGAPMLLKMTMPPPVVQAQGATTPLARTKGRGTALQQAKRATIDQVKALRGRPEVASADLNYLRRPFLIPDDARFPNQWNASMINLPPAWDQTVGSADLVMAVVDTGVLLEHPDLAGRLCTATEDCRGYDFVSDLTTAADGDGIDADPADPGDESLPDGSSSFHGTHIAGIAGASGNNGIGVAGVDWTARIMPVRVLGVGGGTTYDVLQGVSYAAGLTNDSGTVPVQRADVINLSLGGAGFAQAEQDLYNQLHAAGILVVAAAGNAASSLPLYPASYAGVVSVSGVDIDKNLAYYSNDGAAIDVAAPGGSLGTDINRDGIADGIMSTAGDDRVSPILYTYVPYAGTSMAAAHVSGVAALMKSVYPALTPAEFDALLSAGSLTEDLGADGAAVRNDSFGYGLIDAQKAVFAALALAGGDALPPSLAVSPSYLNFGALTTTLPLTLSNAGGGILTVASVTSSATWITVDATAVPGDGLGTYTVSVDRTGLTDQVYSETLTVATIEAGSVPVTVLVQVGASGVADAGYHRIELVDAASGAVLQSLRASADPVNGTYSYTFSGVAPGSYRVAAGTDSDNDGSICDPGEACGRYPLLTDPAAVDVTIGDLSGIDFSSGF